MNSQFNVNKKSRIFRWWNILIIALLFVGFLVILFPKDLFLNALLNDKTPSHISVSYLKNLINNDPANLVMKISLAEQEVRMGHEKEALTLIEPYVTLNPTTEQQWKILSIDYQVIRSLAFALAKKNPERLKKEATLKQLLPILVHDPFLKTMEIEVFAKDALAFEQTSLAVSFYKIAVSSQTGEPSASFYAGGGQAALFIKDYQTSAKFYLLASEHSSTLTEQRKYFINAINSLKLSGNANLAFDFALKHIGNLNDDKETLIFLTKLALESGQHKLAEQYVQKILQLRYIQ